MRFPYVNKLPIAIIVDFLKVLGVTRRLGTKATAILTFNLSAPLSTSFNIPANFEVIDSTGNYSFLTDTALSIPPGLVSGSVTATAEVTGSSYNLASYTLIGIPNPLTFLSSVTNLEGANGGSDPESDDQVITRGLVELRVRSPISQADFEFIAETELGVGSRCRAIGLLGANRTSKQLGAIHLFLLNANQEPANSAQLIKIQQLFSERVPLGSSLYTSPMELLSISADLIAKLVPGREAEATADELWEAYQSFLNPSQYPLDEDIILNEVEFALRATGAIRDIESLLLNGQPLNVPLPNQYTLPVAFSLNMSLVSDEGVVFELLRGAGEFE
ncbi:baseplate J/gp47 family protein [Anabaena sp. CCY 9402-a]|uniref:baseplate J/gp47 family protein n=1 Tax=Anabaena sp. CCY 9402-a TaxID=3103867 RepID=UPI0039C7525D